MLSWHLAMQRETDRDTEFYMQCIGKLSVDQPLHVNTHRKYTTLIIYKWMLKIFVRLRLYKFTLCYYKHISIWAMFS